MGRMLTRKEFLKSMGKGAAALFCAGAGCVFLREAADAGEGIKGSVFKGGAPEKLWKWSKEGYLYSSDGETVQCGVCPNRCVLEPGDRSICRSKVNLGGRLYSLTYGNPCAVHVDPVEKKPLNHFYPRSLAFSIATTGCNFRCLNCQNWEISQRRPEDVLNWDLFPAEVVRMAVSRGATSIAYTYTEPTTFYEYMYDTAKRARASGLKNILVSNGYVNRAPLVSLCRYLDGANINLKSYDDEIYQKLNGGRLEPVLNTFKTLHEEGVWFEITTLVVPTYIDNQEMIKRMCGWILKELGTDYPFHLLRFFPRYKLTRLPPTPEDVLEKLRETAIAEGLRYVYLGNVPGNSGASTYCHECGEMIVERRGYILPNIKIVNGTCGLCGAVIPGRWGRT